LKDTLVVVNPASAGGRTGRRWPAIEASLRAAGLAFDVATTSAPGDAAELAGRGAREGRRLVVAAGGDGTINEVANGLLAAGAQPASTRLGVMPTGTGGDFRRSLGLPPEPDRAAAVLSAGRCRRIDAGRVTCARPGGGSAVRHFVNIASAGIAGEVVESVHGRRRVVSGELTFLLASVRTLLRWRNRAVRVVIDGAVRDLIVQQVVVANGQFFGGGMWVAPRARPDDGLLDVVIAGDLGLRETMRALAQVREGRHLDGGSPKISHALARRVEVSSPEHVRVETDGERPGVLPAVFEVVPDALEVVCP